MTAKIRDLSLDDLKNVSGGAGPTKQELIAANPNHIGPLRYTDATMASPSPVVVVGTFALPVR